MAKSRSRKSGKGGGGGSGKVGRFAFGIFVLAAIVAVYQIPYDPGVKGIAEIAKSKAEHAGEWAQSIAPSIEEEVGKIIKGGRDEPTPPEGGPGFDEKYDKTDGSNDKGLKDKFPGVGDGGSSGGTKDKFDDADKTKGMTFTEKYEDYAGGTKKLKDIASKLPTAPAEKVDYDRSQWKHWSTVRTCIDTREAVLIRDAQPGSLVMLDNKDKETTDVKKGCKIVSGSWLDPYTGKTFTDPKALDIDHVIPLKYAATHGGQKLSAKDKERYANDMADPAHLLAVEKGENRKKSDKGPSKYLPPNKDFQCAYGKAWTNIASSYKLKLDEKDRKVVVDLLGTC